MTSLAGLLRRNANYRHLWMGQVVSEIGDAFNNVAVFALVMEKTGSGLLVSGAMLSRAIPAVAAGPIAGVILDRFDRRRIMLASDLVRAVVALGFVLTIHRERPWLLYALSALLMFASPFFTAGRAALLPSIASDDEIHSANSLTQSTSWATLTAGTLLGGWGADRLGYSAAFVINSLSFLFSAWAVWRLAAPGGFRADRGDAAHRLEPWREFREGLAYVAGVPLVLGIAMISFGWALGGGAAQILFALFGTQVFPRGAAGIGDIWGFAGIGLLAGGDRTPGGPADGFCGIQAHHHGVLPGARRGIHVIQPGAVVRRSAGVDPLVAGRNGDHQRTEQYTAPAAHRGSVSRAGFRHHGVDPLVDDDCVDGGRGSGFAVR
jgi:MFS family permease